MKINIGSGTIRIKNFINIDYDKNSNPDYILDLEKDYLPFDDNTVDEVIAYHILEHLGEGYFHCMKELYRVCKHNAFINIEVPHHRHETFFADPTHKRPITVFGVSLFSKKNNKHCKENDYANSRLGDYFDVDFEVVEHLNILNNDLKDFIKRFPENELEKYSEIYGNIIETVKIKLRVIKSNDTNIQLGKFNYD